MSSYFQSIIIGGGASGLMCATRIAQTKKVLILDSQEKIGLKVSISGGGKCNFSNAGVSDKNYLCSNRHFVKSALARYKPIDFIELLNKHHLSYEERANQQLFSFDARQIVAMLEKECLQNGVHFSLKTDILSVKKENDLFYLTTSKGIFSCHQLIVATGGLSFPKLGASDLGYRIAKQFGHKIIPPRPALSGFICDLNLRNTFVDLSGLSTPVTVTVNKQKLKGDLLITHVGFSGPVILNASLYWESGQEITIDFLNEKSGKSILSTTTHKKQSVISVISQETALPIRLLKALLPNLEGDMGNLSKKQLEQIEEKLTSFKFIPLKTTGFEKAEITVGGIDVNEISSSTMESKRCSGLHFIGEVLDVSGQLGGFNLHWAWASANAVTSAL